MQTNKQSQPAGSSQTGIAGILLSFNPAGEMMPAWFFFPALMKGRIIRWKENAFVLCKSLCCSVCQCLSPYPSCCCWCSGWAESSLTVWFSSCVTLCRCWNTAEQSLQVGCSCWHTVGMLVAFNLLHSSKKSADYLKARRLFHLFQAFYAVLWRLQCWNLINFPPLKMKGVFKFMTSLFSPFCIQSFLRGGKHLLHGCCTVSPQEQTFTLPFSFCSINSLCCRDIQLGICSNEVNLGHPSSSLWSHLMNPLGEVNVTGC